MKHICLKCNKEFEGRKERKYCSRTCQVSYQRNELGIKRPKKNRIIKICIGCGSKFEVIETSDKKYCSQKCWTNNQKGENNSMWKNGSSFNYREYYYKHNEKKCVICGSKDNLHIHHLDTNRKNNDLNNLICLCIKDHSRVHMSKETFIDVELYKETEMYDKIYKLSSLIGTELYYSNKRGK